MRIQSVKGYVLTIGCGLLIAAGAVLVILQWGNTARFSLYGKNQTYNTALVMVGSILGGMALIPLVKLFIHGVKAVRRGRMEGKVNRLEKAQKKQETSQTP